jgi:hypothetical protein
MAVIWLPLVFLKPGPTDEGGDCVGTERVTTPDICRFTFIVETMLLDRYLVAF